MDKKRSPALKLFNIDELNSALEERYAPYGEPGSEMLRATTATYERARKALGKTVAGEQLDQGSRMFITGIVNTAYDIREHSQSEDSYPETDSGNSDELLPDGYCQGNEAYFDAWDTADKKSRTIGSTAD